MESKDHPAGTSKEDVNSINEKPIEEKSEPARREFQSRTPPVVIVGAGPTGLSAAYHLGKEALLVEQNGSVGGWCRSCEKDGFIFDWAGHIMFSGDPYVHQMYNMLLGDNVHWQDRESWIYSQGVYTRYPFQSSLYGLPPEVIADCLLGVIETRLGSVQNPAGIGVKSLSGDPKDNSLVPTSSRRIDFLPNGSSKENHANKRKSKACHLNDCCADGILESTAELANSSPQRQEPEEPQNFEEFIYQVWGRGIAKHFAIPYNRKFWAVDLKELDTSWLGGRVPLPDLQEMIEGALKPSSKPMGPDARFGYPLRGGFQALMNGFLPHLRGPLWLNKTVACLSPSKHRVTFLDGQEISYETLVSTMPLPLLVKAAGKDAPPEVQCAAQQLRHVSVRCVHLGVGRANLTDKNWVYYPEDPIFHRMFMQGNTSPFCNPPGGFGLTCEITYSPQKPLPCEGKDLIERCIDDCIKVGIIDAHDTIRTVVQVDMPHAYAIYDHKRAKNVELIRQWVESQDIILAGRYSEWEYYNADHAFLAGKKAAERCRN